MPGLDGYAVCRRLREREDTAVLPVIMLTASDGTERVMAIEAGADDFVTKPFDLHELLARIRSLLRITRYHDTIAELNRTLERRVRQQVAELERLRRLQQVLIPQRLYAEVEADVEVESVGELTLKGFQGPVLALNVLALCETVVEPAPL